MSAVCHSSRRGSAGFTLIEVMITVAIIGILAAIAIPSYVDYVLRGKLVEATTTLQTMRASMEQYYQDNRSYAVVSGIPSPCSTVPLLKYFVVACTPAPTALAYTIQATGNASTAGFVYTIDQVNGMTSTVTTNWDPVNTVYQCWIVKRGGTC